MKTTKIFLNILAAAALAGFAGCSDYLDLVPDDVADIQSAFTNRATAYRYLGTCYSYCPAIGDLDQDIACSEGIECWHFYSTNWGCTNAVSVQRGNQNSNDPLLNPWDGRNGCKSLFMGIRDINIFLENLDLPADLTEKERIRWKGEALFLKAFYHYWLMKNYGPVPITDENLPIAATPEQVKVYRDPVDDVVDYCDRTFMEAYQYLPDREDMIMSTEAGRADKQTCLAMRAEMLVFAASPLFNGNSDYANLKDNRGRVLFNQTYDPEKWKRAADAVKMAIDACEQAGLGLYNEIEGVTTSEDPFFQQQVMLRQIIGNRWNKEIIWSTPTTGTNAARQNNSQPRLIRFNNESLNTLGGTFAPTINMAEKFYTNHGVPMSEDVEWINNGWYNKRYTLRAQAAGETEKMMVRLGEKTAYMHYNREPRFYADLGFDRGIYYGQGKFRWGEVDEGELYTVQARSGENAGIQRGSLYSCTGYFAKKMHDYSVEHERNSIGTCEYYAFPAMRMAGLYLLYAECLNEYYGPNAEVYKYIDMVRERAGLEGVVESWSKYSTKPDKPSTKEGMRDIIKQERCIELCFESQFYWDCRRWKDMIKDYNEQPKGWNLEGETPEDYYQVQVVARTPVFMTTKDYFMPLRESSIITNRNLVQNYGW